MVLNKLCSHFLSGQTTLTTLEGLIRILRCFEVPSQRQLLRESHPVLRHLPMGHSLLSLLLISTPFKMWGLTHTQHKHLQSTCSVLILIPCIQFLSDLPLEWTHQQYSCVCCWKNGLIVEAWIDPWSWGVMLQANIYVWSFELEHKRLQDFSSQAWQAIGESSSWV